MGFQKLTAFTDKVADLPDKPALPTADLKAHFDKAPDEVRTSLNSLIDALKATTGGDSGAKNIGASSINGLLGNDVQSLLEALKEKVDSLSSGAISGATINGNLNMNGHDVVDLLYLVFKDTNADNKLWKMVESGINGNLEARQYDNTNQLIRTIDFTEIITANGKNERVLRKQETVAVSGATLGSVNVTFAKAFKTGTTPTVTATALSSTYFAAVTNVTNTGFTLVVREYQAAAATTSINCNWIAMGEV